MRLDVERVLVTHGEPVLPDGARALAASLARRGAGRRCIDRRPSRSRLEERHGRFSR